MPLTTRGDSARGFVSTVDPSLKTKMKRRESLRELQKSESGAASPVSQKQKKAFFCLILLYAHLDYDNKRD